MNWKRLLLCLGITAYGLPVAAQDNTYELRGFMGIQGGESFSYRLVLQDSAGDYLKGYAYTYSTEKNEVKAAVTAQRNRVDRTLQIRETAIIHNHKFQSRAIICLVESLLTYDTNERQLSGPLRTQTMGQGAECAKGSISFNQAQEIATLFQVPGSTPTADPVRQNTTPTVVKRQTAPARRSAVAQPAPDSVAAPVVRKPDQVTEGKDKTYLWTSDQIVLEIWDGTQVDNDRISILYNGDEILSNYSLTKERKRLSLPLGGNELNMISIIALNEGGDPPNTANVLLIDGSKEYEIIAHNKIGKQALIKIRKQP